jgi:VanZ family protein
MKALDSDQLARLGGGVLDMPRRTRNLLLVAGLAGVVIVLVESLVGGTKATLPVDKVLHFSGYCILAVVFVLGLRPRLFIPALVGLIGMGVAIEYLQPLNGRTFDWYDAGANSLGVAVGGAVGLLIRAGYAYVRKELAAVDIRRRQVQFRAGDLVLRQGQPVREFYVISRGEVTLTREADGVSTELGDAGPGQAVGVVGVIRHEPQYCSVRAKSKVSLVRMSLDDLFECSGGQEAPVSAVLASLAEAVSSLGDRLAHCRCGAAQSSLDGTSSPTGVSSP